jgi:hypothetical protein
MSAQYHIICELKQLTNRPVYFDPEKGRVDVQAEQHAHHVTLFGHSHSATPELPALELDLQVELLCKHLIQIAGVTGVLVQSKAISLSVAIGYYWKEDGIHQSIIDAITSYLSLSNPEVQTLAEWQKANGFEPLAITAASDVAAGISAMIIGETEMSRGFGLN